MGSLVSFSQHCCNLTNLKTTFNSKVFVETGCFYGKSLEFALAAGFDFCYSCDIDQDMIDHCNRTLNYKNFEITLSNSVNFLEQLLPRLDSYDSVIFFLDAHLPGHDKTENYNDISVTAETFPLEKELDTIFLHRPNCRDVIICDDLRIYEDGPFTSGVWHDRHKFNLNLEFLNHHAVNIQRFYQDEGYFVLTGKA